MRFFLRRYNEGDWAEVTRQEFTKAERDVGLRPFLSPSVYPHYMDTLATHGFISSQISGKVLFEDSD